MGGGTEMMSRGIMSPRDAPGALGPKAALFRIRGGLFSCGSPTVAVSLCLRVSIGAACDPFAMDILLDDCVALPVNLPVDRGLTVIALGAWRNGRGCRAGTGSAGSR
jgi:hypothetical protein